MGVPYKVVEQGSEKIKEYMDLSYEHEDIDGRIYTLEKRIRDKQADVVQPLMNVRWAQGFNLVTYDRCSEKELISHLLNKCTMQDLLIVEQDIKALIELQLDLQKWKYKLAEVRNKICSNGWDDYF